MTKKSKTKNKVTTTSVSALEPSKEEKGASPLDNLSEPNIGLPIPVINNGKLASAALAPSTGYKRDTSSLKLTNNNSNNSTPSLASIPGIVDDFLAPKFVKVLNLRDRGFEKKPPPDLAEVRAREREKERERDANANKVEKSSPTDTPQPTEKKNKRKKNKPVKNTNANNVSYDSEEGRELDVLDRHKGDSNNGFNENGKEFASSFQNHLKSGLTSRDVNSLAQLERIRSSASAFRYEGNNIVLVSNEDNGAQYSQTSCYDDYNYDYDADDDLMASGGGPGSASAPSEETSTPLFDHDEDDDDEREGSWSLSHQVDYSYPSSKQHASVTSNSLASSESENISSISTTASGSTLTSIISSSKCYPALSSCSSIWDGANNPCEIKDCSKPATKKCSPCKTAFYCGEDHQRLDWKKHKNECIPYRMESRFSDDVSVAVASRNIHSGQTIFRDKPLLVIPIADPESDFLNVMDLDCIKSKINKKEQGQKEGTGNGKHVQFEDEIICCKAVKPACFGCLKSVEFIGPPRYNCARCKLPLCSYKCHLDPFHQSAECQALQSLGGWTENQHCCYHSMYMDIEIIRALQLGNFDTSMWDRFLSMKINLRVESYKNSRRYQRFLENYRELVPISAKMSGYHDDLIGNVHAIITALSFRPSLHSPYKLLFATQILFGHDCIPNTFHYLEESPNGIANRMTLVTKAAEPIMKKEIITIDFSPTPFLYYPLRRMILRNVLSIECCNCRRCRNPTAIEDHTNDIQCTSCARGRICPEKPVKWQNSVWACNGCLEEFPYQKIVEITTVCREELESLMNHPRHYMIPAISQFIIRREKDLNPGHSIILQAWSLIEAHLRPSLAATRLPGPAPRYPESTLEDYRLLKRSCDAIESHLDVVRPGICYERGCILFSRYYIETASSAKKYHLRLIKKKEYIQELMQSMKKLQDALKIFQMYEGYNRDVALHIQETTAALVTTKAFIQELLLADSEENRNRKIANSSANLMA